MWDEVRAVFWLEYRRHLRSRRFWRHLLLIAGLSLGLAGGVGMWFSQSEMASVLVQVMPMTSVVVIGLLGSLAMLAPALIVPHIFSDSHRSRELPDIYLTALHPLSIVLGRCLAAGAQMGIVLLTLAPAGVLICQIAGFAPSYWLAVLAMTWFSLLILAGLSVLGLGKHFPGDSEGRFTETSHNPTGWLFYLLPVSLLVFTWNSLFGVEIHLPFLLISPILIPYEMLNACRIGSLELPLWLLALPVLLGFGLLTVVASAQWLGWWSDTAYRFQRWGGTAFFLTVYALHLGIYAQSGVRSAVEAERIAFIGMLLGVAVYLILFVRVLGYYGIGARPRPLRHALPYPLGGVVWEWALVLAIALIAWLTVGWASGYWVDPRRWLMWSLCLMSLLWLMHAVNARFLTLHWLKFNQPFEGRYLNLTEARVEVESTGTQIVRLTAASLIGLILVCFVLSRAPAFEIFRAIGRVLMWLNPVNGLSAPDHSLLHYALYSLYALGLALFFAWRGVRKGREKFALERRAQSVLESIGTALEQRERVRNE